MSHDKQIMLSTLICHLFAAEFARVVCYFPYYSFQFDFFAENVKPELCTHIMYVYSGINKETYEMEPIEPATDREESKRCLCLFHHGTMT